MVLESPSLNPLIETSVVWRDQYIPLRTWLKKWKTDHWMKSLNGLTLTPSESRDFEDLWIASLRESRANRLVAPGNSGEQPTSDGFGRGFMRLYERSGPRSFFWRRSRVSKSVGFPSSSLILTKSGMWGHGIIFERPTWRPRTKKEKESSCSQDWRTPTASDATNGAVDSDGSLHLSAQVRRNWTTPSASMAIQGQNDPDGRRGQTLAGQARGQDWPSPTASMITMQDLEQAKFAGNDPRRPKYSEIGKNWPTPTINGNHNRAGLSPSSGDGLSTAVKAAGSAWPTPTTRDWKDTGDLKNVPENCLLARRVMNVESGRRETENRNTDGNHLALWSTPRANDSTGPCKHGEGGDDLKTQVNGLLNPRWTETLQGIPIGWTNVYSSATESYRQWRLLHGLSLNRILKKLGYIN